MVELHEVVVPGAGEKVLVPEYANEHRLPDGRVLRIEWIETLPVQPGRVTVEPSPSTQRARAGRFATTTTFSGQRASVNRLVCVRYKDDILAGIVVAISLDGERPIIRMLSDQSPDGRYDSAFNHFDENLPHAEVRSEADIATAPERCWFWPPMV